MGGCARIAKPRRRRPIPECRKLSKHRKESIVIGRMDGWMNTWDDHVHDDRAPQQITIQAIICNERAFNCHSEPPRLHLLYLSPATIRWVIWDAAAHSIRNR